MISTKVGTDEEYIEIQQVDGMVTLTMSVWGDEHRIEVGAGELLEAVIFSITLPEDDQ